MLDAPQTGANTLDQPLELSSSAPQPSVDPYRRRLLRDMLHVARSEARSGGDGLMQWIAEQFGADGAVIWKWNNSIRHTEPTEQYFRPNDPKADTTNGVDREQNRHPFWHNLSPEAPTSKLILAPVDQPSRFVTAAEIEQFRTDKPSDLDFKIVEQLQVRNFLIAVIAEGDEKLGTLNLYWRKEVQLSQDQIRLAETIAYHFPVVEKVVEEHTSLLLLQEVSRLTDSVGSARTPDRMESRFTSTLQDLATQVETMLEVKEASIYLANPEDPNGGIILKAKSGTNSDNYCRERYASGDGITGQAFLEKKLMSIPDLFELHSADPKRTTASPELLDMHRATRIRNLEGKPAPLPVLVTPLMVGTECIGVLRVSDVRNSPFRFQERHQRLLLILASQIANWCYGHRRQLKMAQDLEWSKRLTQGLTHSNDNLSERLEIASGAEEPRRRLLEDAVQLGLSVLSKSEAVNVCLADDKKELLRLEKWGGKLWQQKRQAKPLEEQAWRIADRRANVPALDVYRTGDHLLVADCSTGPHKSVLFPECKSMLVVAIRHGRNIFGSIGFLSRQRNAFGELDVILAKLLGRQVGLYLSVLAMIQRLRRTQSDLTENLEVQRRTFETLQHQLKNPALVLVRRAERMMKTVERSYPLLKDDMNSLRALCRRNESTVMNVRVFAALARGEKLPLNPEILTEKNFAPIVEGFVKDFAVLSRVDQRPIQYEWKREGAAVLGELAVRVDLRMLEHMIGNLLENAAKYSYSPSTVTLRNGTSTRNGVKYFFLGVANHGVPISVDVARKLQLPGERGDQAAQISRLDSDILKKAEGTGLGLYIVKQIVTEHRGYLEVEPTNSQTGITEFRLLLPHDTKGIK
jgi:signal transduction histidine kinase